MILPYSQNSCKFPTGVKIQCLNPGKKPGLFGVWDSYAFSVFPVASVQAQIKKQKKERFQSLILRQTNSHHFEDGYNIIFLASVSLHLAELSKYQESSDI